jgi:hypothetical protein
VKIGLHVVTPRGESTNKRHDILSRKYTHRPRHAIYMTWQLVDRYGERSRFMLCREPGIRGEITEQLMARQDLLTSRGVIELASTLYFDSETGSYKRGAAARSTPGCIARYIAWLQQIMLTYDIFSMSEADLASLLPPEFGRFRDRREAA